MSVACGHDEVPPSNDGSTRDVLFTFTMCAHGDVASSRGTSWAEIDNSQNTDYDAAINPTAVSVAIYTTDGTLLTTVDKISCTKDDDADTYTYYGLLSAKLFSDGTQYRCMVIANTDADSFRNPATLLYNGIDFAKSYTLPMWGVKTFTYYSNDTEHKAGNIDMLRAAAKCRIHLSTDMTEKGYSIDDVVLSTFNTEGYVAPSGYVKTANTAELDYAGCFNPTSNNSKATQLSFIADPDENGSYIVYFTECNNTADAEAKVSLTLKKDNVDNGTFDINFKNYNIDTQPLYSQLTRNHVYDYTITGVSSSTTALSITSTVSEWSVFEEKLDFEDNVTVEPLEWVEGTYYSCSNENKFVTLLTNTTLQAKLRFLTPNGATWLATLTAVDADDSKNVITFEDGSTYATGYIDGNETTLQIIAAEKLNTTQHKAKLTIYVKFLDGSTTEVSALEGWTIIQTI